MPTTSDTSDHGTPPRGPLGPTIAAWAPALAGVIAIATLIGWAFDHEISRGWLPGAVAMNPATAIALLALAGSLWLQRRSEPQPRPASALALMAFSFGALKLVGILFDGDIILDSLLFRDKLAAATGSPNRMAPNTALCFLLLGLSLWHHARDRRVGLAQLLAFLAGGIAAMAALGYLYQFALLYHVAKQIPMAFNTAVAFSVITAGTLALRQWRGGGAVFMSTSAGGYMARRLLPAVIGVPTALGALRLWGERAGLYGTAAGELIMVLVTIVLLTGLIAWTARAIERTDRRRRAAESRIQDLYDHAPCGYHSLDSDGRIVEINKTELAWLGYARGEILGMRFVDVIAPDSREWFDVNFLRFKESGEVHDLEFDLIRKNGTTLPVLLSATAIYDEAGNYVMSRTTIFDITARRGLEQELRESSLLFESIFETLPLMVFLKDATDLRFVKLNRAGEELIGYRREVLFGKNDYDFFPPELAESFVSKDREVLARSEVVDVPEERIQTAGGETRILHTRKVPIAHADGAPRFLLGISEDITERRRAEERIQLLNKELETFSYSVSHDLRAPLRAIVGFSQALLEDHAARLDESGRRFLDRIVGAGQRMNTLIDALLEFSRLSRAEVRRQPVDLTRLAREIEGALRDVDPAREVDLVIAEGLRAQGDPRLLRVVLENLIGNAWKFTRDTEAARMELGASEQNGKPRAFFVRDNGAGFDMQYVEKLFAPFQRLHAATQFEGTGIGLTTVHRIIERHGGRIWAEGAVGGGATFYFTLAGG